MNEVGSQGWGYLTVWDFKVRTGQEKNFERIYGSSGDWVQLFRRGEGYVSTQLSRNLQVRGRYLVFDFWTTRHAYESFRQAHAQEYAALDARCEQLTEKETPLGAFEPVGA